MEPNSKLMSPICEPGPPGDDRSGLGLVLLASVACSPSAAVASDPWRSLGLGRGGSGLVVGLG